MLFDLDGTLADTIPLLLAALHAAYAEVGGTPPDQARWLQTLGRPLRNQLREWENGDAVRVEALATSYRDWQRANLERMVRPYEGIDALVRALGERGHPLAIVTGKGEPMARETLAVVDLLAPFELIVGAESTSRHKPDPDPLLHALKRLGVPAAGALYVGDAPNDILAARAAGMIDVWAAWGPFTLETLGRVVPTHVAASPADVLVLIDALDGVPA